VANCMKLAVSFSVAVQTGETEDTEREAGGEPQIETHHVAAHDGGHDETQQPDRSHR